MGMFVHISSSRWSSFIDKEEVKINIINKKVNYNG